jgi:hypothetical protein
MSKSLRQSSMQDVAEFKQTALFVLQYLAIFFSKSLVRGPVVIHPDFKVSQTKSISELEISGGEKFIRRLIKLTSSF